MMNIWGLYLWLPGDSNDSIHPDDLKLFKATASNVKVFECVEEDALWLTLRYGNNSFRVKRKLFKTLLPPRFIFNQKVEVKNKAHEEDAVISDVMWHFDKKEYYYFIQLNKKKKSKRYFENELTERE